MFKSTKKSSAPPAKRIALENPEDDITTSKGLPSSLPFDEQAIKNFRSTMENIDIPSMTSYKSSGPPTRRKTLGRSSKDRFTPM